MIKLQKNNSARIGIPATIILISGILIAVTATSLLIEGDGEDPTYDFDKLYQITDEATDEIVTYIQIKDIVGKYNITSEKQTIQQIAILIKPLFSTEINITNLIIKLHNNEEIRILNHNELTEEIKSHSLFKHPIWDNTNKGEYSIIITHDTDKSILNYNTINSNTDMAYITIPLPEKFAMKKGDSMTISLIPAPGTIRTTTITAPIPTKKVVTLL